MSLSRVHLAAMIVSLVALIVGAAFQVETRCEELVVQSLELAESPVTIYHPNGSGPFPVLIVAHGFGGSRQMMEPIASALARSGHLVVSFEFLGHGRNSVPMSRDLTRIGGTAQGLI